MVITAHINKWEVTRVLVDNGSQAEILFLSAFEQMGFDIKQLKEASWLWWQKNRASGLHISTGIFWQLSQCPH
jgi:hypothetical protein